MQLLQKGRAKQNNRGQPSVGMTQGQDNQKLFGSEIMEVDASQHESSAGWVDTPQDCTRSWDSDRSSSGDYLVIEQNH